MPSALARSYLFAPGNQERLLRRVFAAGADAVVLDLEDAVPAAEKARARGLVEEAVGGRTGSSGAAVWVRINGLESEFWQQDLAVVAPGLSGLRLPKAESVTDLGRLDVALTEAERRAGLEPGAIPLTLTIESARGLLAAPQLAALPRVDRLAFGAADFLADVGADPIVESRATLWARSYLVAVSRAAGLAPPIAPAWTGLEDDEGLRVSTLESRQLGFFGRSCIHPRQLSIVHEIFTPSAEEIEKARRLVAGHSAAERSGMGVSVAEDGQFVDAAVVRRARSLIDLVETLDGVGSGEMKSGC
jgi:citrate lyase subunit beta/citryl-CoA lyase